MTSDVVSSQRRACALCGSPESRRLWRKNDINIVACRHCGLIFADVEPASRELEAIYTEEFFTDTANGQWTEGLGHLDPDSGKLVSWRQELDRIEALTPRGRLLDVGCGPGFFLQLAQQRGWQAEGIDISYFASKWGREHLGVRIRLGELAGFDAEPGSFAVVTMWDVIEHTVDPLAQLEQAWSLLEPGGLLALSTGDVGSWFARLCGWRWRMLSPPMHLFYFSVQTLTRLLERAGFRVMSVRHGGRSMSVQFILQRLHYISSNSLYSALLRLVEGRVLGRALVPVNLGDVMTIYARKEVVGP
jgi:SAM-dependent methyltransferase